MDEGTNLCTGKGSGFEVPLNKKDFVPVVDDNQTGGRPRNGGQLAIRR